MKTTSQHKNAVTRVRKYFPQVTKVVDAKKPILITVKKIDSKQGKKKSPNSCALARACVREKHMDGAIINIGTSYLIKGNTATRFLTSEGVGREITSFDRHQDFAAGRNYRLSAPSPSLKLSTQHHGRPGPKKNHKAKTKPQQVFKHRTSRIRISGK